MKTDESILQIISQFNIEGNITQVVPWGNGLINDTFRIYTDGDDDYLMQRINEENYPDIEGIMRNIYMVTDAISHYDFFLENGITKQKLRLITPKCGGYFYRDADLGSWRIYNFMKETYSIERAQDLSEVYSSGLILGQFHYLLADFPAETMTVHVPDFHNPVKHYGNLLKAAQEDRLGRAHEVLEDITFFEHFRKDMDILNIAYQEGHIPLRVNHNDPKINNIMFDNITHEPLCMVDLDTMMPGLIPYDFGDAIRSCMCTGKDRPDMDPNAVVCDMRIYNAYLNGFLDGTQGILTPEEEALLPVGARLIAIESAMRYLTDYLNGDVYLKVRYPKQNLIKSRMHVRLALDMENKLK